MNVTPSTYSVCHASLKKAGSVVLVLLMLSVASGAEASPGCLTLSTSPVVQFNPVGALPVEIAGLTPCIEYTRYDIVYALDINSTTLRITLLNGFMPVVGDHFDILDWGSITGTFGTIDTSAAVLQGSLAWDTSQLYITGELCIVDTQSSADGDLAPWGCPDGQINAADVLIAQQLVLEQRTPGQLQYTHGDMNSDGSINTADLLLITQAALP